MQVHLENLGTLARKMVVQVPCEQIDTKVVRRLREMSKTIKLPGFRQGKVPFSIIEQKFAQLARSEVVEATIKETLPGVLKEQSLSPVLTPILTDVKSEPGSVLEYAVTFEVFPQIELQPLEQISIEKPIASVTDELIEATIQKIRKAHAGWVEVSREAKEGDKLVVSFKGEVNGQERLELAATNAMVEIGGGVYFSGFESALIGLEKGSEKSFSVTFPGAHPNQDFAGKKGDFHVTVHQVLGAKLPELDADFYKKIELPEGTVEKLKEEVGKQLESELQNKIKQRIKEQIMGEVLRLHPIDLPEGLVARELYQLEHKRLPKHEHGARGECKSAALPNALREQLKERAKENITLSLFFSEIIKRNQIKVPPERVKVQVENFASGFGERADKIIKMIYENGARLEEIKASLLEELVIEKILERATITEKRYSYEELVTL